jgi:hypothetical protein
LAWLVEECFAPESTGLVAREGAILARNFANIFFNMTGKGGSV